MPATTKSGPVHVIEPASRPPCVPSKKPVLDDYILEPGALKEKMAGPTILTRTRLPSILRAFLAAPVKWTLLSP